MNDPLRFDSSRYEVKTYELEGRSVTCRAFEGLEYCRNPVDPIQKMNLYVPERYYHGASLHGYGLHTAPIFMPNTVGGYMPGPADSPGLDEHGQINAAFAALEHGYVVACAGVRGRTSGRVSNEFFEGGKAGLCGADTGRMVGRAPALIVDMKAAIRYLRHNRDVIPGDTQHIITNGTSAGGALSAMAGASGNSPDYEPYLEAAGAARERDDIFAVSCYCPIHNLEHADAAYEWLFCGENMFYRTQHELTADGQVIRVPFSGSLTQEQIALSRELKRLFPAYLNSLRLVDDQGAPLTLNEDGTGSFLEYLRSLLIASAQRELDTHDSARRLGWLAAPGSEVERQDCLTLENGKVIALDWEGFRKSITRMKAPPAFDALDLTSPENEEFGDETVDGRHFSAYSYEHSKVNADMADDAVIKLLNPTRYIRSEGTAFHWRIRHGAFDRDTSIAIPAILALLLQKSGCNVDFWLPWGLPHSGDYDLDELFRWIDGICR